MTLRGPRRSPDPCAEAADSVGAQVGPGRILCIDVPRRRTRAQTGVSRQEVSKLAEVGESRIVILMATFAVIRPVNPPCFA